ncbi:DUF1120 domain-containing protein [Stenotrophomonas maltophilia]|uniref:DUF1120 domain-containing protein n=1 Tax=Stenotrophomonas maltophilia TaxID=40324 RepID=UPI001558E335|nr:DUF1120 domain-containing protein [Stenotrophomonas maltophilia]
MQMIDGKEASGSHQVGLSATLLLAMLLVIASPQVLASDCEMTTNEQRVDFGKISRQPNGEVIGRRAIVLNLLCKEATDLSLFYRADSVHLSRFAFGDNGSYVLQVRNARVDGRPVELGKIDVAGGPPTGIGPTQPLMHGEGVAPVLYGQAAQGRSLVAELEVTASVERGMYSLRDAVEWHASGLIEAPAASAEKQLELVAAVVPGACVPTFSNGGVVDLGSYSPEQLNANTGTRLPPKSIQVAVQCDAPTLFALAMQDSREGTSTVDSAYFYGLGLSGESQKIGAYNLVVDPSLFSGDGFPTLYRTDSTTSGVAWSTSRSDAALISSTGYVGFSDISGSSSGPVPIQSLSGTLTVEATIAPTRSLNIRNVINIDGLASFEIIYL